MICLHLHGHHPLGSGILGSEIWGKLALEDADDNRNARSEIPGVFADCHVIALGGVNLGEPITRHRLVYSSSDIQYVCM